MRAPTLWTSMSDAPPFTVPGFEWDPVYVLYSYETRRKRFFRSNHDNGEPSAATQSPAKDESQMKQTLSVSSFHQKKEHLLPGMAHGHVNFSSNSAYRRYVYHSHLSAFSPRPWSKS